MDTLVLKDIREVWDEIRPGLEQVRQKTEAPWRAEDVYASCVVGAAFLYAGEPGFVICQPDQNKLTGQGELLVWVAFSVDRDSVERFQPAVDALARENGFSKLTMWSNRPGWQKHHGWKQVAAVYERTL